MAPCLRNTPQYGISMVVRHLENGHHQFLQPGKGQTKFLLVRVDYFTKWIEAEPLASLSAKNIKNFICRSIVCQFEVHHTIVTDNGRQFIDRGLQSFYEDLGIKSITNSVEHPRPTGRPRQQTKLSLMS